MTLFASWDYCCLFSMVIAFWGSILLGAAMLFAKASSAHRETLKAGGMTLGKVFWKWLNR